MRSIAFNLFWVVFLASVTIGCQSLPTLASEIVEERAQFDLKLAFLAIAKLEFISRSDGRHYAVYTDIKSTGMGTLLTRDRQRTRVVGVIRDGERVPVRYHTVRIYGDGTSSSTIIEYKDGVVDKVISRDPHEEVGSVQPDAGSSGWDFLTVIYEVMGQKQLNSLCQRTFSAFDGKKTTEISLEQPVRQLDGLVRCAGIYQRFSGPDRDTAEKIPFEVFYRRTEDRPGWFEFFKMIHNSNFGPLRIVRQ